VSYRRQFYNAEDQRRTADAFAAVFRAADNNGGSYDSRGNIADALGMARPGVDGPEASGAQPSDGPPPPMPAFDPSQGRGTGQAENRKPSESEQFAEELERLRGQQLGRARRRSYFNF
jgi:hypothetical protein